MISKMLKTYSRTIRAKTKSMKSQTQFRFVFIVTRSLQRLELNFTENNNYFRNFLEIHAKTYPWAKRHLSAYLHCPNCHDLQSSYHGFQIDVSDWMASPIGERYLKTNLGFIQNIHLLICHFIIRIWQYKLLIQIICLYLLWKENYDRKLTGSESKSTGSEPKWTGSNTFFII